MADDKVDQDQAPLEPEELDEVAGGAGSTDSFLKIDATDSFIKLDPG